MDKFFLLTYTIPEGDGFRHSRHAWFSTETALKEFLAEADKKGKDIETDLAIEISSYREIDL